MFSLKHKVTISDIAANEKMSVHAMISLLANCEQFQIDAAPGFKEYYISRGYGIYLTARQADIIRLPDYGEAVTVSTYVHEINVFYGVRNTFIYDAANNPIVKSYAIGANIDLAAKSPVRIDKEFVAGFKLDPKQEMFYAPRRIAVPDTVPQILPPFTVPDFFIDFYQHMNNVHYVTLALECIKPRAITRVRAEYKAAAVAGDKIIPTVYREENRATAVLADGRGGAFAHIEITE
ncbi:MAG: thioesterase [Firmicutes bacterium]|nr:thioesterase [Bacillota bacterium]